MQRSHSLNGTPLDPEAVAVPCGLFAKTFMNDTYQVYSQKPDMENLELARLIIDDSDIVWEEQKIKYKNLPGDWESI